MTRRPPRSPRPDTPFPFTTLFRSPLAAPGLSLSCRPRPFCATCSPAFQSPTYLPSAGYLTDASASLVILAVSSFDNGLPVIRSEEHTSELQSLMRISYAVFCLTKKKEHM